MTARPRSALAGALAAALLLAAGPARAEKMDDQLFTLFKIDELEHRWQRGEDIVTWDGQIRIGNDDHKLALKSEGEYVPAADRFHGTEVQALYLRRISDFFDAQIGVRQDLEPRPTRAYGVIGVSGLAPQWFEIDANLFISERGHASARLEAEYDVLLTQRLVLEASGEIDLAFADDRAVGIGGGFSSVELGLRLRYEIEREFAPYIGINWERKLGRTADLARADGEEAGAVALVVGLRLWF